MKMPTEKPFRAERLIIKKAALKEIPYHYDRTARLSLKRRPEPDTGSNKSIFRKKSPLFLILLNLFVIVILLYGYNFYQNYENSTEILAGYKVQLFAFKVQDTLYAFVSFEKITPQAGQKDTATAALPEKTDSAAVTFKLKRSGMETRLFLDLTEPANKELKTSFPGAGTENMVEASITLGENSVTLIKKL